MTFNVVPSNELLKPSKEMGFSLHLRKKQSSSKAFKESSPLHQSNPYSKDPDKLKSKSSAGPEFIDSHHKARHDAIRKTPNREKNVKRSSTQSDELVKYMSNLPCYLRRADGLENVQEKALNFGVLDWSRLEKWSNRQMHIPALYSSFKSSEESSSTRAATTSSNIAAGKKKLDDIKGFHFHSSGVKASYKEDLPECSTPSSSREFEPFGKTFQSYTSFQKGKMSDYGKHTSLAANVSSKSRHHGVSLVPNENANNFRGSEAKKSLEGSQQNNLKKKERIHKPSSPRRLGSLKLKNKGVSFSSPRKYSSISSETKKMMEKFQKSDVDVDHKQGHSKPSNIVLLRPNRDQQSSSAGYVQLSQLLAQRDDDNDSESSQSSSFTFIPEEVYTKDVSSEILPSRTLHSVTEPSSSSETIRQRANTDMANGPSTMLSSKNACSDKISTLYFEDKFRNQCVLSNNMKESQEQETDEMTNQSGRSPSSNHRPSFGLDQMRRSFSLKERPTLPQLSSVDVSTKSGPLTFESSACLNNHSKEKAKGHKRTRSSPFVRLFDPILKHKASNIPHSDESNLASKGSTACDPHDKSKGSSVQALLQMSVKNGLPLFKFVVNNERKVLAATMKSLSSQEKEDAGCYFAFYLVNEIKKKSGGWRSHVSKEKNCGYAYNMVGQMRFSSSKINETSNQNFRRQLTVKEYVLLRVDVNQTDQEPSAFTKRRELAAVVIEIPFENSSHEGLHKDNLLKKGCLKCSADERCFCITGDNDICGTTTAIIPGGVHSSPNNGEPSPLIYRWKSRGTCDCGGWDVGCKLLVLSNQKPSSNVPRSTTTNRERFQLYVQEGAEHNKPFFTLSPLKDGFYSVEFGSAIDHLQAFFVAVAVLSCQKLPSSLEMSNMHGDMNKVFSSKDKNELQGKSSINYNPIPPLSPVGRV